MIQRRRAIIVGVLVSIPIVMFGAGYWAGYRVNVSPSYPLGLWRIDALKRDTAIGDRIFICPLLTEETLEARARGYFHRGLCPGWISPLIKTVVALPGQSIEIDSSVVIDGRSLPNSALQPIDGSGRAMTPYAGGVVPPGFLFLHSPFRGSYDSRYFGPIPAMGVLGLATPILTVAP